MGQGGQGGIVGSSTANRKAEPLLGSIPIREPLSAAPEPAPACVATDAAPPHPKEEAGTEEGDEAALQQMMAWARNKPKPVIDLSSAIPALIPLSAEPVPSSAVAPVATSPASLVPPPDDVDDDEQEEEAALVRQMMAHARRKVDERGGLD